MKNIIILAIFLCLNAFVKGQASTTLVVSNRPPSALAQWAVNRETVIFVVQPISQGGVQFKEYKIKTELQLTDGTVIGRNDLNKAPIYSLGSTTRVFNADEIIPTSNFILTGSYQNSLQKTGKLPADNYQLCVQLVAPTDYRPLVETKCRPFFLAAPQLPILLKPSQEEMLNFDMARNTMIFRWSPVVPAPKTPGIYKLRVFEVMEGQNPVQAMRANFPVLEVDVRGTTQYIWQPRGILEGHKGKLFIDSSTNKMDSSIVRAYVWTIQSFDAVGLPIGEGSSNGDGVSEPAMYRLKTKHDTVKNSISNVR